MTRNLADTTHSLARRLRNPIKLLIKNKRIPRKKAVRDIEAVNVVPIAGKVGALELVRKDTFLGCRVGEEKVLVVCNAVGSRTMKDGIAGVFGDGPRHAFSVERKKAFDWDRPAVDVPGEVRVA
jgi:hypothetical protein